MADPLVSVIIPAFNGERYLGDSIESVLGQTYEPLEIIVVDDGSTDSSAEIAASYEAVTLLRRENGGPGPARNTGVEASSGEILAFHDQDDLMRPRRIEVQTGAILADPQIEWSLAPQQGLIVEEGATMPDWDRTLAPAMFGELTNDATMISSISLVVTREAFDRVGAFDPEIFAGDELDWMLRASEQGIGFTQVAGELVVRRIHSANLSQDVEVCRDALLTAFRARLKRRRRSGFAPTARFGPEPAPG